MAIVLTDARPTSTKLHRDLRRSAVISSINRSIPIQVMLGRARSRSTSLRAAVHGVRLYGGGFEQTVKLPLI
jgi:hypothetical protein